jgi:hypothetical protein
MASATQFAIRLLWITHEFVPPRSEQKHRLGSFHRFAAATRPGRVPKELNSLTNEGLLHGVSTVDGQIDVRRGLGSS